MSYNLIVETAGKVRELRGHRRSIFKALAGYAHKDGTGIFPSHAVIADEVGVSVKTVERHIKAMLTDGWLIQDRRRFNNLRTYAIPFEKIGLTVQMVEESLKPRKKKAQQAPFEQEEADVSAANELAYTRLQEMQSRTSIQKAEAKVANLAHQVVQYENNLRTAHQQGDKYRADAIEPNLFAARQQLQDAQRALETLQQKERERELQT